MRGTARGKLLYLMALALGASFGGSRTEAAQLAGVLGAHDPSPVIQDGTEYYYFATGQGIVSRSSSDLINWNAGPSVFNTAPAWTTQAVPGFTGTFWAPDAIFLNNQFYLYYAVSTFGSNVSAIGLATSPTLNPSASNYAWTDQGVVVQSTSSSNFNAIDPSVMQDATTGRLWMTYGSFWSGIYVRELDPTTGKPKAGTNPVNVATGPGTAVEGSTLVQHGGFYYLFVNWGACCDGVDSTYNIRVGRSASPTGPFLDANGVNMLNTGAGGGTLFMGNVGNMIGPGGFGMFSQAGQDYFSFHYYSGDANGAPTFGLRNLYWTSDGWPSAAAVNPNWLGATSGNWSDPTNWTVGGVPNGIGNVANFAANSSGHFAISVDGGNKTVSTLNFTSTSSYTVGTNAGNTITMHALTGDSDTINVSAGNQVIAAPLTAGENLGVNVVVNTTLAMSGSVTGPSMTKYGRGNLTISGAESYTGSVLVHAGAVNVTGSVTAGQFTSIGEVGGDVASMTLLGTGSFTANADFNVGDTGDNTNVANGTLTIGGSATLTVGTAGGFYVGSGFSSNTQASGTVNQSGGTVTANGNFDGAFVIAGRTSSKATGTYNLSGGTVNANTNVQVGGHGNGTVTQTGGTFTANSYLSIGRFSGGKGTYAISAGTLNETNAATALIVGESGNGTLTVSGSANVTANGALQLGKNSGSTGTINLNGGTLNAVTVSRGAGTGTLNWNGGTLAASGNSAAFLQGLTNVVVQTGGAVVNTGASAVTIALVLKHDTTLGTTSDGGLKKNGTGSLTLTGANTFTGATVINSGTVVAGNVQGLGTGGVVIHSGGNLVLQSGLVNSVAVPSVTFDGGPGAWLGALDVTNDKLIVEAAGEPCDGGGKFAEPGLFSGDEFDDGAGVWDCSD